MKRLMIVAVPIAMLAMVGSYGVLAQQDSQTPQRPGGMMGQGGMMHGMMGQGGQMQACPMCGMMVGTTMMKTMTATPDGGVIIAVGNRLMKYDNQLNLVKDTEMKIDVNQMFSNMQKMMENCPMARQTQQQGQPQTQARQ
jgi:hypothetical protein